ncbi:Caax amino terminal protease family protein [Sulfitobacter noctilucae]|uniref:CPBP family intramembrane glutamic endopeptidase n=1 Tax=Sulfitobacter noctilucae TaxID=1342302 RepID=UPI00046A2FBC|nr:CPBP family intramembrane glutamic endopeptidase [Sulfitobacter noctilucae]KIN75339.1 Caax amino terminal protease family protein [Sulfitobacter noctilucae]
MKPAPYAPHEVFIAPARHKPELWRFVAGLVLAGFAYILLSQVFFQVVYNLARTSYPAMLGELMTGRTALAMYLLLLSFGFMSVGVAISVRLLHSRSFLSLLGPIPALLRDFRLVSLSVLAVMAVVFVLPPWGMGGEFIPNMPVQKWLALLFPSLILIFVQVSAEEVVFRGYVQQQLAVRFRSPWAWMVLPSVLFALGHYLPDTAGDNALIIALWAGMFGILMADLTARAGSLGPAIAVHFWNNVSAMLIVSLPEDLSGLALYLTPFGLEDTEALRAWLPVDFAMMLVMWLAARLAIRR